MATLSITMNACGGSSTSQKIYYGKSNLVTGNALTGTGWTLYSGAPISASTTSITITSLDDNVDYSVERYCNCPTSGDIGPERINNLIKNVCGTFGFVQSGSTTVNYQVNVPPSASSAGGWIDKVLVELLSSSDVVLQTNTINKPFSSFFTPGNFAGLNPATSYKVRIKYSNTAGTRTHACVATDLTTSSACSAPTVTLSNVGATSMDVVWSVSSINSGDTYNIIRNGVTIASGLGLSASPYSMTGLTMNTLYQIGVQRNCGSGGQATGQTNAFTVNGPTIVQTCYETIPVDPGSLPLTGVLLNQCFTIGDSVAVGNRFTYTRYGYTVSYTAIPGDNKYDVAFQLGNIAMAVTDSQWRSGSNPPPEDLTYFIDPYVQALGPGYANGHVIGTSGNAAYPATVAAFVS